MDLKLDTVSITPLLRLTFDKATGLAAAALRAATRLPLEDEAHRAIALEAHRIIDGIDPAEAAEDLFVTLADIPVRSVRSRLRAIAALGEGKTRECAFRALAGIGDPQLVLETVRRLEQDPNQEDLWPSLARMPVEASELTPGDVPLPSKANADVQFWRSIVLARLGVLEELVRILRGQEEAPTFTYGNPWVAYAYAATVRPLPTALCDRLLAAFGIGEPPDPEAVREAGLLVWALTGIADAEGDLVRVVPVQGTEENERTGVAPAASDVRAARKAAKEVLACLEKRKVPAAAVVRRLHALPPEEGGSLVVSVVRLANRGASNMSEASASNTLVEIVSNLPRSVPIPVAELYEEWAESSSPAIDADQLAWIVSRAPLGDTVEVLATRGTEPALDLLSRVADARAGRAGSPYRGAGGVEIMVLPQADLIDDEEPASAVGSGPDDAGAPPFQGPGDPGPPGEGIAPLPPGTPPPGATVPPPGPPSPAVLSAEGPKALNVGQESEIRVRIEWPEGARPLAHAVLVDIRPQPISVIVVLAGESVRLTDPATKEAPPPTSGRPSELSFAIVAKRPGPTTAIVHFQQGATRLAMLSFPVVVVAAGAGSERVDASGSPAPPHPLDKRIVDILIQEPTTDTPYYTYFVTSEMLELHCQRFQSKKVPGRGDGVERAKGFAAGIYRRIESELLEKQSDLKTLTTRLEDIGVDLCKKLFPEELVRALWRNREDINTIAVTPVNPLIPWELLRLDHPEEGRDTRHLAEYQLVRTLGGKEPARALGRAEWRYVLGEYPHGLYADLPAEREFVTRGLTALGVSPVPISADVSAIRSAIEPAAFDVLHVACHGEASLDDIEASALIIADRLSHRQGKTPVKLLPSDLSVPLSPRRPLIFLSACQSALLAPSLTDFGGWPRVLVNAEAGAMVGTLWAVYEKPAIAFATAFYKTLLDGRTLAEAAGAGRAAARRTGDASWLAYTVYGRPSANMPPEGSSVPGSA